ncbi:MAG: XylR family transcriptional regulator [Bacillota bacterium]
MAKHVAQNRPRVALIVETSVVYGREIHEGIAAYVHAHRPWSIFVEQRELGALPPRWLTRRDWDGIISRPTTPALARTFRRRGLAVVDLNDLHANLGLPRVRSDNRAIGHMAATHLIDRGFRQFAFCGFAGEAWSIERREGFVAAIRAAGFETSIYESYWRGPRVLAWDADQDRITRWLARLPRPLGISACNDLRGQHVLEACRRANLAVPEDVAVIGVDNEELLCRLCDPPLSTVIPSARRIGYEAAQLLDGLMSGAAPPHGETLIPPAGVITRQSTDTLAIGDPEVGAALRFIRENACEGIRVVDVLRQIPISRSLLERRFRQTIGRSPHAEIRLVQVRHAAQLLAESDLPLKRIAQLSGFSYTEYLSYFFKRAMGQTPRDYRRSHSTKGPGSAHAETGRFPPQLHHQ